MGISAGGPWNIEETWFRVFPFLFRDRLAGFRSGDRWERLGTWRISKNILSPCRAGPGFSIYLQPGLEHPWIIVATFLLAEYFFVWGNPALVGSGDDQCLVKPARLRGFWCLASCQFPPRVLGDIGKTLETLQHLAFGFGILLTPSNLFYCFAGVLMGTLVGVLPGLGPPAAIALLLPITFYIPAVPSLIMLSGIIYGAMYGGSTTSILVNIPGEAASVVTCFDGYQMARHGRAGPALGIAALGSFIAGTFGVIGLMLFAPTLSNFALRFGPPEFFSLAMMSLTFVAYVSRGSVVKSLEWPP